MSQRRAEKALEAILTMAEAGLSDRDLLRRHYSGDRHAFEALVRRHGPRVLGKCEQILRDHEAAKDAFQEAFQKLLRHGERVAQRGEDIGPWLNRVAQTTALDGLKRLKRQRTYETPTARLPEAGTTQGPAEEMTHREEQAILMEELAKLPHEMRKAFVRRVLNDEDYDQIARSRGTSSQTVRSMVAKARTRLEKALIRRGVLPATAILIGALGTRSARAAVPAQLVDATVTTAKFTAAGAIFSPGVGQTKRTPPGGSTHLSVKWKIAAAVILVATGVTGAGIGMQHSHTRDRVESGPQAGAPKERLPSAGERKRGGGDPGARAKQLDAIVPSIAREIEKVIPGGKVSVSHAGFAGDQAVVLIDWTPVFFRRSSAFKFEYKIGRREFSPHFDRDNTGDWRPLDWERPCYTQLWKDGPVIHLMGDKEFKRIRELFSSLDDLE